MSVATTYPHLIIGSDGVARIEGTRFKVLHLAAEHHHNGWSAEELLRQHPQLRPEQVYAALTYFYDHRDELLDAMDAEERLIEGQRKPHPTSRDELLGRKSAP